ncbi:MAG TPA: hypothetical protein VHX15_05035 [Frankiaceae bacterium]|jgi:hypothetical protein|nr:hypothetical protein [Frankiaceae bacterium]
MNLPEEPTTIHDQWVEDPARLCPRDECRRARLAWELVAPSDGKLPVNATPLQCMLYARMTTSIFVYEAAQHRTGVKATQLPA